MAMQRYFIIFFLSGLKAIPYIEVIFSLRF